MRYITLPENIETKVFVLDSNALTETPKVLQKYFPGKKVQIVADGNTWRVAGEKVQALCRAAGLQEGRPQVRRRDVRGDRPRGRPVHELGGTTSPARLP